MHRAELLQKFHACKMLSAHSKRVRSRSLKQALIGTAGFLAAAVGLSLSFDFSVGGWILACSVAFVASITIGKLYKFFVKPKAVFGTIVQIEHDYRLGVEKGTGGLPRVHSSIRQQHQTVLFIQSPEKQQKLYIAVCPPECERIFAVGDAVLYHPDFKYPATLSNITKCICMNCGIMQSTENTHCYQCGAFLCNHTTAN